MKQNTHTKNKSSVVPLRAEDKTVDKLIDEVFNEDGNKTGRNSPNLMPEEFASFIGDDYKLLNSKDNSLSDLTKIQNDEDEEADGNKEDPDEKEDDEQEDDKDGQNTKVNMFNSQKTDLKRLNTVKAVRKYTMITDRITQSGRHGKILSKQDRETKEMLDIFQEVETKLQSKKVHAQKLQEFKISVKLKFLGLSTWFVYSDVLYNIEIKQEKGLIGKYNDSKTPFQAYDDFYKDQTNGPQQFKDETNNEPISEFSIYQGKSNVKEWDKYMFQIVLYTIPTLEKVGTLSLPFTNFHHKIDFKLIQFSDKSAEGGKQSADDNNQSTFLVSYIGKNELIFFGHNQKYHVNLPNLVIQIQTCNIKTNELSLIKCGEFLILVNNQFKIDKVLDIDKKDFLENFEEKEDESSQFICNSPNTICNKGLIINKKSLFKVQKTMKKLDIEPQLLENFNTVLSQKDTSVKAQYDSYNNQIYFYIDRKDADGKDLFRVHLSEREYQVTHPIIQTRFASSSKDLLMNYIQDDYLICCFINIEDDTSKYLEVIKFYKHYKFKLVSYEPFEMGKILEIQRSLTKDTKQMDQKKFRISHKQKHLIVNYTERPKQNQSYLNLKDTFVDTFYVTNCEFMKSEIFDIPKEQLNLQCIQIQEKNIFTSYIKQCDDYLWDFTINYIPQQQISQLNLVAFDKVKKQSFSFKIYEQKADPENKLTQEIKRVHLSECLTQIIILDTLNKAKIYNINEILNESDYIPIDNFITLIRFSSSQFVYIQLKEKRYFLKFCKIEQKQLIDIDSVSLDQYIKDIQLFEKLDLIKYKYYESQSLVVRDKYLLIDLYDQYLIYDLTKDIFMGKIQIQNQKRNFSLTHQLNQLTLSMDNPNRKGKKMFYIFEGFLESYFRLNYGQFDVAYDFEECLIIFKDFSNQPIGVVSFEQDLQLSIDQIELVDSRKSDSFAIQKINKMSFREIANYIDSFNGTLLHIIAGKSDIVVNSIRQRLSNQQNQYDYMLFVNNEQGHSAFDYYVMNDDYQKINFALDLMVRFQNNSLFNSIVDKNLIYLIEKNFDLKDYLQSKLPICYIETSYYPQYSKDPATLFISEFDQSSSLARINYFYKDEVRKYLKKDDKEGVTQQIEYLLPVIPISFSHPQFMEALQQSNNEDLFESDLIQIALSFKWDKYAFKFHLLSFLQFFIFLVNFIADVYFLVLYEDQRSIYQQWTVKIIGIFYILFQLQYEFKTILVQGVLNYLSEYWNYVDIFLILLYVGCGIIDLMHTNFQLERLLYSICLVFVFIKFFSYLRIFQGFSFLVQMLRAVFVDLKFFIALYGIVIVLYGLIFTILEIKADVDDSEYQGISYFGYFIMSFRASTGDFQVDNFHLLDSYHVQFAWIIWVTSVLFLNIILLNFIIAVISQSYEKIMQRMIAQSYMAKAKLIYECELHYSRYGKGDSHFPRYFILRRIKNNVLQGDAEWQGFVKDIKKTMEKVKVQLTEKQDTSTQKIYKKLDEFRNMIQANNEEQHRNAHEDLKKLRSSFKRQEWMMRAVLDNLYGADFDIQNFKPSQAKRGAKTTAATSKNNNTVKRN
ncbi:serine threonine protein kinase [Stylonychia lemnae]|uniref:Serine threonine protein kinase n=1 Tax=Stylonychia lemnae TaxID=5949 RepID=A0A078AB03_STYLE|nr:serine threonine protein kinase [Stylonychia lemnae]|eukprot:CDW79046.1 serine threonine protein kinase [Stylonychia lemnae]